MDTIVGRPDMQRVYQNSVSKARQFMAMDQFAKRAKELFILSKKTVIGLIESVSLLIGRISTYKKDDEMT